tara:strand:- start:796 stop:1119 length:324 start_codon:yes stop_codon:yes gene_type:complete
VGRLKTEREIVKIYTWKTTWDGGEDYNIQVEIENCGKRARNKILKAFEDWDLVATGDNLKKKLSITVYRKKFESTYFWKKWIKQSSYKVYKFQKNGSCKLVNKGKAE